MLRSGCRSGISKAAFRLVGLVVLSVLGSPAIGATSLVQPIQPSAIAALETISALSVSPTGNLAVYALVGAPVAECPGQSVLWEVSAIVGAKAHALHGSTPGDTDPQWAPDGRRLAFLRGESAGTGASGSSPVKGCVVGGDHATPHNQVWILDGVNGLPRQLTSVSGTVYQYRWSPDGQRIAVVARKSLPGTGGQPVVASDLRSEGQLYVVDVVSGKVRKVPLDSGMSVYDLDWLRDGLGLVVRYGRTGIYGDQFYQSKLAVIDLQGRFVERIDDSLVAYQPPRVSPSGRYLLYGRFVSTRGLATEYVVYDLKKHHRRELGVGWLGTVLELRWLTDNKLSGVGLVGTRSKLISVDSATGDVSVTYQAAGQISSVSGRTTNGVRWYIGNTPTSTDNVWTFDERTLRAIQRTDHNPEVRGWPTARLEEVTWKSSRDGTVVSGLLALPNARLGDKGPFKTLVQAHGGPLFAWEYGWQGTWEAWAQIFTSRGYAVFMPNPRGSTGYGAKFANANVSDWGGGDYQDILDGVASLIDRGVVDKANVAIGGWSYGGYMTAWASGHNRTYPHFKAAVVGAAPIDLTFMVFNSDLGPRFTEAYFGDPIANHRSYWEHSPISGAKSVTIPVLIMHGTADERVPTPMGVMYYRALQSYHKSVSFVEYPGADHWVSASSGSVYQCDIQRRAYTFVAENLGSTGGGAGGMVCPVAPAPEGGVAGGK